MSEDGTLRITAYKISGDQKPDNRSYLSARMNTNDSWQYGYFEMRAKLPVKAGCWSAFWMLPKDGSAYVRDASMDGGELDILEHVPGEDENAIHFSAHSYYTTGEAVGEGDYVDYIHPASGAHYSYTSYGTVADPTAWHIYSMLWTETEIRAFIDGEQYYYAPNPYPGTVDLPHWGFEQEFYIKLNLAVGGDWGGTPANDFSAETFEIDYVRVYQQ